MKKICIDGNDYISLIGIREILSSSARYEIFLKRFFGERLGPYTKYYFFDGTESIKGYISKNMLDRGFDGVHKDVTYADLNSNNQTIEIDITAFGMFQIGSGCQAGLLEQKKTAERYNTYNKDIEYHEKNNGITPFLVVMNPVEKCFINGKKMIDNDCFHVHFSGCNLDKEGLVVPQGIKNYKYILKEGYENNDVSFFLGEDSVRRELRSLGYELRTLTPDEEYIEGQQVNTEAKPFKITNQNEQLTPKEEKLYKIIAVLVEKVSHKKTYTSEAQIITDLGVWATKHAVIGMKKRTLENVFSEAKKVLREKEG